MQILPQFDPWGQVGQQFGSGIGNYLMQAADRSRFRQNLSAAQQLMEKQAEGGKISPAQLLFGLYGASEGNPAFLQSIGEIYPTLAKEYQRQALLANLQGGQNQRGQQLPNGQVANRPPWENRQYMTPSGQPQQAPPYNAQMYEDSTGSVGGAEPGGGDVAQRRPSHRAPSSITGEQHLGQTYPIEQSEPSPQFQVYGPEEEAQDKYDYLTFGGDPDRLYEYLTNKRNSAQAYNQTLLESQKEQNRQAELRRALAQEQDEFLYGKPTEDGKLGGQLGRLGWDNPQTQRIATQNFLIERGAIDPRGLPAKETDRKAWLAAEKKTQQYIDARKNLESPEGRSFLDYDRKYRSTQDSARKFLNTIPNSRNVKTGEYDLQARNEAEKLLMEQGWLEEEAADLSVPTSSKTVSVIKNAPNLGAMPITQLEGKEASPEHRRAYQQVASSLLKDGLDPNDSLLVIRRQLHDQKGWDAEDFQNMLDVMKSMGYQESTYQAQENLNKDIKLSLNEIWDGLFGGEKEGRGGRTLKRLYQRPKEL